MNIQAALCTPSAREKHELKDKIKKNINYQLFSKPESWQRSFICQNDPHGLLFQENVLIRVPTFRFGRYLMKLFDFQVIFSSKLSLKS